ncbi:MAG: hypothetical protein RL120_07465, partial [Gammaproteobacteria bacterium]
VLAALARNYQDRIVSYTSMSSISHASGGNNLNLLLHHNTDVMEITAGKIILCAGEGNTTLLREFGIDTVKTQLRPLKMVYLKHPGLAELYLQCIVIDISLST